MERGVECVASMTVHPSACATVLSNVRELQKLGVYRIDIRPAYGTVQWSEVESRQFAESLGELALLMKSERAKGCFLEIGPLYQESEHVGSQLRQVWGCKAGASNLAFLPDGSIASCSALAMLAPRFPLLLLGDVWNGVDSDAVRHLRQDAGAGVRRRALCKRCPTRDNCAGGCLAINYSTSGVPLQLPTFYCKTIAAIPEAWEMAWGAESEVACG
jgi:radical SAM protein with 4Fe4S-binding SPASM domain